MNVGQVVDLLRYCRRRLDGLQAELEEGLDADGEVQRWGRLAAQQIDEAMYEHVQQTLRSWQEEGSRRR